MDNYFDFMILAEERFSVRSFTDEPVLPDIISRILHAGHVAPTACNLQPQRIYVLQSPEALQKLKTCTPCHFNAPLALLVCADMKKTTLTDVLAVLRDETNEICLTEAEANGARACLERMVAVK